MLSSIVETVAFDTPLNVLLDAYREYNLSNVQCNGKDQFINEDELYKTARGGNFVQYRNDDVSIFGTVKNLEILSKRVSGFVTECLTALL